MSPDPEIRTEIPAGEQEWGYHHLFPIAELLIERGHHPIDNKEKFGFCPTPGGVVCTLTHRFTEADWAAINERFVLPDNIRWHNGLIRDTANWIDMMGADTMLSRGEVIPIEAWEERQRARGLL